MLHRISVLVALLSFYGAFAADPALYFSDLVSGPNSGNTDTSLGQTSGQDGAIVTVWGVNLGSAQNGSTITIGGVQARVYSWCNATAPANLFASHGAQMIAFQIPAGAPNGATTIQAVVNGTVSNTLPFTVQAGKIFFVKTTGNDSTGDGSWTKPWASIPFAVAPPAHQGYPTNMNPGDILYVCNGVQATAQLGDQGCAFDIGAGGTATAPKAMVGYPGAVTILGNPNISGGFSGFVSGAPTPASYWTVSKLSFTGNGQTASLYNGCRFIGNHVTAPNGTGPQGAVGGSGNDLYVLGNEVTNTGFTGTSKLYHPIYIQSDEDDNGPTRLPTESNREIAWNYLHDNFSYDGINIYREGAFSAYMTNQRIHDNFIYNQTGRGMLIGDYMTGENWVYNNVIIKGGQGPDPDPSTGDGQAMHCGVDIQAGAPGSPATLIHFYNNTIYGCGWSGAASWATGDISVEHYYPYQLDFRNNLIQSVGEPYLTSGSQLDAQTTASNNLWFGNGAAPSFDSAPVNADPKLVNPATGNVRLQSGSPAIDAGSSAAPVPSVDFDHIPRPQGTGFDIGAFEFSFGTPANTPPVITSAAAALPNPAQVGQTVSFMVGAQDPDGDPLTYAWDFGDSASGSGSSVTHAYAAAGVYTVTATISDNLGQSVSSSVSVTVNAATPPPGSPPPAPPPGSPPSPPSPPPSAPLTVTVLSGKIVFASSGHDSCSLSGSFSNVGTFTLNGATLSLDVGGAQVSFTLNKRGTGRSKDGTATLHLSGETATFSAKLKNGSWSALGMTQTKQTQAAMTLPVSVTLNGSSWTGTKAVRYTNRNGKTGTF